jgi:hypothetical protein
VWELVSDIMKDPEQLRDDLERMIEQEDEGLYGDPEQEAKVWTEKLAEVERMRSGLPGPGGQGAHDLRRTRREAARP